MYSSTTGSTWSYESITYASNPTYSVLSGSERPFGNTVNNDANIMDLACCSNGVGNTRIFNNHQTRTDGYSTILSVSSTQIQVRLFMD